MIRVGHGVVFLSPMVNTPVIGLVEAVHEPEGEVMMGESGQENPYFGEWPRVTMLILRARSEEEVEASKINNLSVLNERQSELPVEYLRLERIPHLVDAEYACMLTDGNLNNMVNIHRYAEIITIEAGVGSK